MTRLKDLLGPVGKKLRLEEPGASAVIWRRWPEIVGEDVAANAEPTSLKDGVLRVRTVTPTWATEMSYLAGEIRDRVNKAVGKPVVSEVKVWTSPAPITRARSDATHRRNASNEVVRKKSSEDPETAFRRAFEAWSRRRSKRPR